MLGDKIIRKVRVLGDRARQQADEMGLDEEDLVLVEVEIEQGIPPKYHLTKIEGSPVEWLQERYLGKEKRIINCAGCKVNKEYYGLFPMPITGKKLEYCKECWEARWFNEINKSDNKGETNDG